MQIRRHGKFLIVECIQTSQKRTLIHLNWYPLLCKVFFITFSPEVWRDQPYNKKSDIWSLGCVLYEMTMLKPPFRAEDMEGLYKKVTKGTFPKIASHYS